MIYQSLLRPLLFQFDAEQAHEITYNIVERLQRSNLLSTLVKTIYSFQSPSLTQKFWGLTFRNPVGLAAGFDKNGCLVRAMETLGMGFIEVGSVTAQAHGGNPKPRAFRLPDDQAIINRMGLNNDGVQTVVRRLQQINFSFPLGINIAKTPGPNITGEAAIKDYLFSYREAQKIADYITINISCPNTEDGRTFEDPVLLDELLSALINKNNIHSKPTLVKFSSDISREELQDRVDVCEDHQVDGYVASNTSASRKNLMSNPAKIQAIGSGGLSGPPISFKSTRIVQWLRAMVGQQKPIIGVGGINSFQAALKMLQAGADLLQCYTGLIYEGPSLVKKINRGLANYLRQNGLSSIHKLT
ncbi:MAG TPA: quinone-dependent dihydroorotate dehydrogenase [Balneolaceae bacterium]|nr:quinone-dependent dihydroorotate dehydrogenase [Balneolaceae bacterium]